MKLVRYSRILPKVLLTQYQTKESGNLKDDGGNLYILFYFGKIDKS